MSSENNLQELFGSFRAEWLLDERRLYELFSEPSYFPSLTDKRSCALVGGRGSGKTTALRCMSYEGQYALSGDSIEAIRDASFIGLYHRVSTPHVTAFQGVDQTAEQWRKTFSHYFNLVVCEQVLQFLSWFRSRDESAASLSPEACTRSARALGLNSTPNDDRALLSLVQDALIDLETFINNLDGGRPTLSMLQTPIDVLIGEVRKLDHLRGKIIYLIFDEFENFLDEQQRIVNTVVKHSGSGYVFKIGVRELGWRVKGTLNEHEHLIAPADYELISIESRLDASFVEFARKVCETRLSSWYSNFGTDHLSLREMLPSLRSVSEAVLLGVSEKLKEFDGYLRSTHPDLLEQTALAKYVFLFLEGNLPEAANALARFMQGAREERNRYHNYHYALLFTIAPRNAEISKYYCGNDVFALISKSNIRFYLQLVAKSIELHLEGQKKLTEPISFEVQTKAARAVGLQYLTELEGTTRKGSQLVKLLLGFGRLFQLLAMNPRGGKPECNQFQLTHLAVSAEGHPDGVEGLLQHGVMNLALVRAPGTKLASPSDIREWEYALHPIFAPYFNFSHRRKRKMEISDQDLLEMVERPKNAIRRLLRDRPELLEQEMPVQLRLFDDYFAGA